MQTFHLSFPSFHNDGQPQYTEAFNFSGICCPKKIEAVLNVDSIVTGINDGSSLNVILQRSIDGDNWIDDVSDVDGQFFKPVFIDSSEDPVNEIQAICIFDDRFLGNWLRFKIFQTNSPSVPSVSTFSLSALVK